MEKIILFTNVIIIAFMIIGCGLTNESETNKSKTKDSKTSKSESNDSINSKYFPTGSDGLKLTAGAKNVSLPEFDSKSIPVIKNNEESGTLTKNPHFNFERLIKIESYNSNGQLSKTANFIYGTIWGSTYDPNILRQVNITGSLSQHLEYGYDSTGKFSTITHHFNSITTGTTFIYYYDQYNNLAYKLSINESTGNPSILHQYIYEYFYGGYLLQIIEYQYNTSNSSWTAINYRQYDYYMDNSTHQSTVNIYLYSLSSGTPFYVQGYQIVGGWAAEDYYFTNPDYFLTYSTDNTLMIVEAYTYTNSDKYNLQQITKYVRGNTSTGTIWQYRGYYYFYYDTNSNNHSNWEYFSFYDEILMSFYPTFYKYF